MKRYMILLSLVAVVFLIASIVPLWAMAPAASFDGYAITWYTIDSGGGTHSNGIYEVSGTMGQPDTGVWNGGAYTIVGGFWNSAPTSIIGHPIYLPLMLRG